MASVSPSLARRTFAFANLPDTDLVIDAVYEGGRERKSITDEPLHPLMGVGNQGGFRAVGGSGSEKLVVLYSLLNDLDWPDYLDLVSGTFTYHGDNKKPGKELHDTKRSGNVLLRRCFNELHLGERERIPPFFVFTYAGRGRDVVFRGLAVPGSPDGADDLTAMWKTKDGLRFQNYRAVFTVLDVPHVSRSWIRDLHAGRAVTANAPRAWVDWMQTGRYAALRSEPTIQHRTPAEQTELPDTALRIIETVYDYFKDDPYAFEPCAAAIAQLMDNRISVGEITRRYRDGGRDATGVYQFGPAADKIAIDFALEAKCYTLDNGVGVKEVSRLISRLRHRQFGILVTTSFLAEQAYKEIREDGHPVMVLAAVDIARILIEAGKNTPELVRAWLDEEFGRS